MKYAILTIAAASIATASIGAKADDLSCSSVVAKIDCSDKSFLDPQYWGCLALKGVTGGICLTIKRQFTKDVAKELASSCSDPHSKACEEKLDGMVDNIMGEFISDMSRTKRNLVKEVKQKTIDERSKASRSPSSKR